MHSDDLKLCHEQAPVKRIVCYDLKETKDEGIILKPDRGLGLTCYIDADFAGTWTPDQALYSSSDITPGSILALCKYLMNLHDKGQTVELDWSVSQTDQTKMPEQTVIFFALECVDPRKFVILYHIAP